MLNTIYETYSFNHRIVEIGRYLQRSSRPTPPLKAWPTSLNRKPDMHFN